MGKAISIAQAPTIDTGQHRGESFMFLAFRRDEPTASAAAVARQSSSSTSAHYNGGEDGMMWIAVGLGGALGSLTRHGVNVAIGRVFGQTVPYATGVVNVIGCLAVGLLAGWIATGQLRLCETARAFIFVGILGGFTTFSSFGLDTMLLVRNGATTLAFANVAIQVGIGVLSVFGGYWLATQLTA